MATSNTRILLGEITAAHGIRGEIVVRTYTGDPEAIGDYGPLSDAAGSRAFVLKILRATSKGVIARIDGVTDRNGAEALKGTALYVDRASLPPPEDAEFYHADLIGLAAVDAQGGTIGEIIAVQNFGAGDLVEIRLAGSHKTGLVPFTRECVPTIDLDRRLVVIVPPAGLLD